MPHEFEPLRQHPIGPSYQEQLARSQHTRDYLRDQERRREDELRRTLGERDIQHQLQEYDQRLVDQHLLQQQVVNQVPNLHKLLEKLPADKKYTL